ncbi:hypothetical protein R1sor_000666 [Riccia sorocarpa]|uniref:F-box domain-containing protein n=1 Tax=Riccia sorocarpa TaxID=122646 RepID=A0ABD3GXR4_9MARC
MDPRETPTGPLILFLLCLQFGLQCLVEVLSLLLSWLDKVWIRFSGSSAEFPHSVLSLASDNASPVPDARWSLTDLKASSIPARPSNLLPPFSDEFVRTHLLHVLLTTPAAVWTLRRLSRTWKLAVEQSPAWMALELARVNNPAYHRLRAIGSAPSLTLMARFTYELQVVTRCEVLSELETQRVQPAPFAEKLLALVALVQSHPLAESERSKQGGDWSRW